jgi:dTDP-4-amino-4,6-dideoxygalactose transaminase
MNHRFIDCVFKANRDGHEIQSLIADIARASKLSGDSDVVSDYEAALAEYFGVSHAIAVSSGTAALHASLAETIQPGDEVLLPVIGVPMTAAAILQAGGVPVFYDCLPNSFVPDIASLNKYSSKNCTALITVPMWGYPGISEETVGFARENKMTIIEDTAQALGTKRGEAFEGTIGDVGCFSTHEFKLMSTGEGGFVLTNNPELHDKIRQFTRIGFSTNPIGFGHRAGLNYKLPALQASLGLSQLANLENKMLTRASKASEWKDLLGVSRTNSVLTEFEQGGFNHNGYSLALCIKDTHPGKARTLSKHLFERGVNTDIHRYQQSYLVDFPMLSSYYDDARYSGDRRMDFPNSSKIIDSLLVLPLHDQIDSTDIHIASMRLLELL